MKALIESLLPSAKSGSLKHLDLSDNNIVNDSAADSLADLIANAKGIGFLNISDSNISDEQAQEKVIDAIKSCSKESDLSQFMWDYDLDGSELSQGLVEALSTFKNIQQVSLMGSIPSKTTRDKLRKDYKARGAVILLTENDKQFEEESESD